ncbi:hypothetical protein N9Z86_00485 [bacterium]|nr:hypothetical protein [bacterium]
MDKEIILSRLNEVLDLLNMRQPHEAKTQIKGLLNEIKHGVYDIK